MRRILNKLEHIFLCLYITYVKYNDVYLLQHCSSSQQNSFSLHNPKLQYGSGSTD